MYTRDNDNNDNNDDGDGDGEYKSLIISIIELFIPEQYSVKIE